MNITFNQVNSKVYQIAIISVAECGFGVVISLFNCYYS